MWNWITRNSSAISAIASVVQALGLAIVVGGLFVAKGQLETGIEQVKVGTRQLEDARNALRANTALQIQKEGRELLGAMDADVSNYIYRFEENKKYDPEVVRRAENRAVQILNFYASVSRQNDYGTIDGDLWMSFQREFCDSISRREVFKRLWKIAMEKKIYRENFLEIGQKCQQLAGGSP